MKRKHDSHINDLILIYHKQYEFMAKNVEYKDPRSQSCGEMDIIAKNGNCIDIYEIKCNNNYEKAVKQLYRAKDCLEAGTLEVRLFYYEGRTNTLLRVD